MKFLINFLALQICTTLSFAQKNDYAVINIADSLKQNANSVVRLNQVDIDISSQRNMKINTKRVITIFNEKGLSDINAIEYYDKKTTVNNIFATVYNSFGLEIKKIKRKDFRDQCVVDGVTIFSDSRFIYLNYTPIDYPFTIVYESEVSSSNTAFIRPFVPINVFYSSSEKIMYNIKFPEKLGFRFKEYNLTNTLVKKIKETTTEISYEANNIIAQKPEIMNLSPLKYNPIVYFSLEYFNLEGIDGKAKTWNEYGKWFSDNILQGTLELPEKTKTKIKALVENETDLIKKAKIVYKFVQEKSRYISIQVGIGGFKPMLASDVDRLGYGDCKALSNYTRALLDVVGVPSYYTELYGDKIKIDINKDFFSIQGNHVILCIPNGNENVFLECTSQTNPFGFQGNFTDDRDVLIIKPDGGEIVRTTIYSDKTNAQISKGKFDISEIGDFFGTISINSQGTQYANKSKYETVLPTEKEEHYKDYWHNIENLLINKLDFVNDKEKVIFTENATISAEKYGKISGNNLIFNVNAFNQYSSSLKKIRNRKTAFEISRGYYDYDEIEIDLPSAYKIESLPSNFESNSKFGEYKTEIIKKSETNLVYKRTFFVKKGIYKNTDYEEYRLYIDQISRNDNVKIVLLKN